MPYGGLSSGRMIRTNPGGLAMGKHRATWYMGTSDGLFLVERQPGTENVSSRTLGLQHTGGFRARIVVDCDDSRRVFVGTTRAGIFRSDDAGLTWQECNE